MTETNSKALPNEHDIWDLARASWGKLRRFLDWIHKRHRVHSQPILKLPYRDHSTVDRTADLLWVKVSWRKPSLHFLYLPVSGTSVGRMIRLIYSRFVSSGESPPCMQKIFSSMTAATGKQLKQSVNVFHSLMLYRLLPVTVGSELEETKISLTELHSS